MTGSSYAIRLSAGSYGRVEIHHPSYGWGTVCDDIWNMNNANVVCRQLGYSTASGFYTSAHYGQGSGSILLDNVDCSGHESYLWDCPHPGWTSHDCNHNEDAGVSCSN